MANKSFFLNDFMILSDSNIPLARILEEVETIWITTHLTLGSADTPGSRKD